MKKFITTDTEGRVQLIHYMPFDDKEGLGMTEEELTRAGYLVDDIPEAEVIEGKIPEAHYTEEKGFYYEYIDAPKTRDEKLAELLASGAITQDAYNYIIGE